MTPKQNKIIKIVADNEHFDEANLAIISKEGEVLLLRGCVYKMLWRHERDQGTESCGLNAVIFNKDQSQLQNIG